MNGVHDMGGMHGMGPVEIEKNEPVFHSQWEARVHALNLACGFHRKWNIDVGRHSRERIPPAEYLAFSYYEKWLRGLEMLLVENGLVTPKELETGRAESKADGASALRASEVTGFLRVRRFARMDDEVPPKFRPGDRVLTHNDHPVGHTRLPYSDRATVSSIGNSVPSLRKPNNCSPTPMGRTFGSAKKRSRCKGCSPRKRWGISTSTLWPTNSSRGNPKSFSVCEFTRTISPV